MRNEKYWNKKVDANPLLNGGMDKQCRDYKCINKRIKHSFPYTNVCQASCDNVLQSSPLLRGEGCNTLSHEDLAEKNVISSLLYTSAFLNLP